jgi:superfamily II DNA or RNA helicase/HKD family nuclease
MPLPPGLYELIVTAAHARALPDHAQTRTLSPSESARRLADHVADHLERALESLPNDSRPQSQVDLVNAVLTVIDEHTRSFPVTDDAVTDTLLTAVTPPPTPSPVRPQLPLSESGLYVNANREQSLDQALRRECESADRIDLICAFLFWQGYARVRQVLRDHLARGRPLRVLTTTYCAATDARVLDELAELGADVRVSYQSGTTRLHAKAWVLHRDSGFGTAFVGSSNLSASALTSGLEWNVRLSQIENRAVFGELAAAFDNHWDDEEFLPYDPQTFREVLRAERPKGELRRVFTLRPRTFQKVILERLQAERTVHDRHRNLVVSATGTGKTVVAALDYARLCAAAGRRLRLLFVAHRKEILEQSQDTFRHAVSDGSFGERYVDGLRPLDWDHVFASVQSLHHADLTAWPRDHFDVVIVDEFHHAAARTYQSILEHFQPTELLGLTATPERADGRSVLEWFDGRIASELRIWDAIDRGLLVPFHYLAIHDTVDLSDAWKRGRYDLSALQELYTGHHARAHLIVEALREHVLDATRMRALAFCVGVDHAEFMAQVFTAAGIPCATVTGATSKVDRRRAVQQLRNGELACLLTVDVFNEGVDIPEIDTLLFLRPTESSTVFLQQLGRGLRLSQGKRCVTVLDFVGIAHDQFRYVDRFRALTGPLGRKELARQVQEDFPYLPSGCSIQLDRRSKEIILDNIAARMRITKRSMAKELRDSGVDTLQAFLAASDLELDELYRGGRTFSELRRIAGLPTPAPGPRESVVARGIARLMHVDDRGRLDAWRAWLRHGESIDDRLQLMLLTTLLGPQGGTLADLRAEPALVEELLELLDLLSDRLTHTTLHWLHPSRVPLRVHGSYRLSEIMAAFGDVRDGRLYLPREGVYFHRQTRCNLLFVTLDKDADDYSPSTMYADYAIGPTRFHWQSQSGTRATDTKGRRHVDHATEGITPLLFVRQRKRDERNETVAYVFLGEVALLRWEGERPMNVEWGLQQPMPADLLRVARVVR